MHKRLEGWEMNRLSTCSIDLSRWTLHHSLVLVAEPRKKKNKPWPTLNSMRPQRLLQAFQQAKTKGQEHVLRYNREHTHWHSVTQLNILWSMSMSIDIAHQKNKTKKKRFFLRAVEYFNVSFQSCEQQDFINLHCIGVEAEISEIMIFWDNLKNWTNKTKTVIMESYH